MSSRVVRVHFAPYQSTSALRGPPTRAGWVRGVRYEEASSFSLKLRSKNKTTLGRYSSTCCYGYGYIHGSRPETRERRGERAWERVGEAMWRVDRKG
jgi:hypothetical protein